MRDEGPGGDDGGRFRPDEGRARAWYRLLLRAYPAEYRHRYGADMEEAFLTLLRVDRKRRGVAGAARCWVGAAWDALLRGVWTRIRGSAATTAHVDWRERGEGLELMGTIIPDVRYALRSLSRRPVFALTAVLTIAIGIGANASVFTVVNGFMFEPIPYEDPDDLVILWAANPSLGWSDTDVNPANAMDWKERARTLEDVAVHDQSSFNLTGGDRPELVSAVLTTPNLLSLIGRSPALGRDFVPSEIGPGGDGVAILTDGFWERRFARDPAVLGSTLVLDGEQVRVIGILPPDFLFHGGRPDLFRPWPFHLADIGRDSHVAESVARLAEGVGIGAAREELAEIARQLEEEHEANEGWTVEAFPLHAEVVGEVASQASVILMGAVGFILLMACVNVANLLLSRAGSRRRELSIRAALGAGRGRVLRQLLTESFVLGMTGGALGVVGAIWGSRAIVSALPSMVPPVFRFEMNADVLAFSALATVGATLLFGVLPALRGSGSADAALRNGGRTGADPVAARFGSVLVVAQTAMAVVLLVGGGLLMKSVTGMRTQDFGFEPEGILTMRISLPTAQYDSHEASEAYWREVTDRILEVPGITEVGTTQSHPLMGSNWGRTVQIPDAEGGGTRDRTARLTYASPGLFDALEVEMARGRPFGPEDRADAPDVAIVNEAFVERYLPPDADPLQETVRSGPEWSARIVGVVQDFLERAVDEPPEPSLYLPITEGDVRTRSLVIRTTGDPTEIVDPVQAAVWSVDGDIPVSRVQTMTDLVEERVGGFAVIGHLMAVFAIFSLLLGAVGIYGVTAYSTGRRAGEIGVRLAMGARRSDVVGMVVREGGARAGLGLVVGMAMALLLGRGLSGILIGVSHRDPSILVGVVVVLALVSFLGLYLPARRASRVDPVRVLAAE